MSPINTNNPAEELPVAQTLEAGEIVTKPEELERRNRIVRFLTLAASGNPKLTELIKKPETLNWLIGMVQKQPDGTEIYISEEALAVVTDARLSELQIRERLEMIKKESTADIDPFVTDMNASNIELVDLVTTGKSLDAVAMPVLAGESFDRSVLSARRIALTEAGRAVIEAASKHTSGSALLTDLETRFGSIIDADNLQNIRALLTNDVPVDVVIREKVLGLLADASALRAFANKDAVKTAKQDIQNELDTIDGTKRLNVLNRFEARADFNNRFGGSNAETVLNFATINGKININVLKAQLTSLGVSIDEGMLRTALQDAGVRVEIDAAVPANWDVKKKQVAAFLESNGVSNAVGIELAAIHAQVDPNAPWFDSKGPDKVKQYTAALSAKGKEAAGIWWKWISSLPDNVIPSKDDAALNELFQREDALGTALETITRLEDYEKTSKESMTEVFDDLKTLQELISDNSTSIAPARGPKEQADQALMLLQSAEKAMEELKSTRFPLEKSPRVRETAFYLAMTRGSADARDYLNNPELYGFQHPELGDGVQEFHERTTKATDASGRDILTPLHHTLGIKVQPNALTILSGIRSTTCLPVNPDTMMTDPAMARVILSQILLEDPETGKSGGIDALITAYTEKKDMPSVTAIQADEYVRAIHQHLIRQIDDYNIAQRLLSKSSQSFDMVGGVRTAMTTLGNMMKSDDMAEKALGWGLAVGGIYALYRGLKSAQWRNWIIGAGVFVGLDVAVQRATGEGILSRLNMTFMNEKDRNSAVEEFYRQGAKVEGYGELEKPAGREATRQLMNPKNPIPIGDLLQWYDAVKAGGRQDYSICVPEGLSASKVASLLGVSTTRNMNSSLRKQEGYRIMFLAFESLCINVADANSLGGNDPKEKAAKGAKLIRSRYADRAEAFTAAMGIDAAAKSAKGMCAGGEFSMLDVLIRERPTPAIRNALELSTWPEYMLAKMGVAAVAGKDAIRKGASFVEINAREIADRTPKTIDSATEYAMASFDSFMLWARPTAYKMTSEVEADMRTLYDFLTRTASDTGLYLYEKAPGVIEWTYDKTLDLGKFTKDKALDVYRELHRHAFVGDILVGFESLFLTVFGESVQDADIEALATVDAIKQDLTNIVGKSAIALVNRPEILVDGWMKAIGIVDARGEALGDGQERLLKTDLLKREIFSYLAAQRVSEIHREITKDPIDPLYRPGKTLMSIAWPPDFDPTTKIFTGIDAEIQETYAFIRSQYTTAGILSLIGQESTIPTGWMKDYAERYPDRITGQATGIMHMLVDFASRDASSEYLAHDLEVFKNGILSDPDFVALDQVDKDQFTAYLETLMTNVLLESAIAERGIGPADLTLTIATAKRYLYNLKTRRGEAAHFNNVQGNPLLEGFTVAGTPAPSTLLETVLTDPKGKWLLAGKEPPEISATTVTPAATPTNSADIIAVVLTIPNTDMSDSHKQEAVLIGLRDPHGNEATFRRKFDETMTNATGYDTDVKKTVMHNYLLGVSPENIKTVEDTLLTFITKPRDLDALTAARSNPLFTVAEKARIQHTLDRATVKLLETLSAEIGAVNPEDLHSNPNLARWREELLTLYSASSPATYDLLPDTVSLALEYIELKGNYAGADITQYNERLVARGLPPVPVTPPDRTFGQWLYGKAFGKDATAVERFAAEDTVPTGSMMKSMLDDRISSAKIVLE